jgi:hypothetical protein
VPWIVAGAFGAFAEFKITKAIAAPTKIAMKKAVSFCSKIKWGSSSFTLASAAGHREP